MSKRKIKKPPIRITELLCINNTAGCRRLLAKYGVEDAVNYTDLEQKIADLYNRVDDKKAFEQELAQLHPHSSWILKNTPVKENIKVESVEEKPAKTTVIANNWEGTEGNRTYENQRYLCACGCSHSSFDGTGGSKQIPGHKDNSVTILGMISVVAIAALTGLLIYKDSSRLRA